MSWEHEEPTSAQIKTIQSLFWEMKRRAFTAEEIETKAPTKKAASMVIVRLNGILKRWDDEHQAKLKVNNMTVEEALKLSAKARLRTLTTDEEKEVWGEFA